MTAATPGTQAPSTTALKNALGQARALVADGQYEAAMAVYTHHLQADLDDAMRSAFQVALGATMCLAAQQETDQVKALGEFDIARGLVELSLASLATPRRSLEWAEARANLAAIYLARSAISEDRADVMSAHLALDGVEPIFAESGDSAGLDWIKAMRDQLVERRDRRSRPR